MTKRNEAYKDANFRKVFGHRVDEYGRPVPVEIYIYEGKTKIYDIIVHSMPDKYTCRVNSRKTEIGPAHKEIDKYFNLSLEGV
jgi:hypothetical protein